jgi:uncharacterized integral membrane protein
MSLQNTGNPAGVGPPSSPSQGGAALPRHHRIRRTRAGGVWVALAVSAVVLILLLIFILENLKRADISLFGAHVDLPIGVALLLAAAAGALIVVIPGTARIVQLRMTARRHRQLDARAARGMATADAVPADAVPAGAAPAGAAPAGAAPAAPAAPVATDPGAVQPQWTDEPPPDAASQPDPEPR